MSSSGFNYYNYPLDKVVELINMTTSDVWSTEIQNRYNVNIQPIQWWWVPQLTDGEYSLWDQWYGNLYRPPQSKIDGVWYYVFGEITRAEENDAYALLEQTNHPNVSNAYVVNVITKFNQACQMPSMFDVVDFQGDWSRGCQIRGLLITLTNKN